MTRTSSCFAARSGCGRKGCTATDLELVQILPDGVIERLGGTKVELKPFRKLASLSSLRQDNSSSQDPFSAYHRVAATQTPDPEWKPLQGEPKQITLIVHGAGVDQELFQGLGGLSGWYPGWAKRMYWAGHPVLASQEAAVVGIEWPSNIPGRVDSGLYYPEDEFNALQAGIPLGKYIAELRQRTGVERLNIFAHSLGNMVVNNALKEIPSSGAPINYVLHEAAVSSEAFLEQYNPAAPESLAVPGVQRLLNHARALGYPGPGDNPASDWLWTQTQGDVELRRVQFGCPMVAPFPDVNAYECQPTPSNENPPAWCNCGSVNVYFERRPTVNPAIGVLDGASPDSANTPFFTARWSKLVPTNADGSVPGAWTRFFLTNANPSSPRPDVRLYNTFNRTDSLVRIDVPVVNLPEVRDKFPAWLAGQIVGKPFGRLYLLSTVASIAATMISGQGATDSDQRWWTLAIDGRPSAWRSTAAAAAEQNMLWGGAFPSDGTPTDRRTRQWAELALWYPATAPAAGASSLRNLEPLQLTGVDLQGFPAIGRNVDMTSIGGDVGAVSGGTLSHSFLQLKRFREVWKGYRVIRELFKQ